MTGSGAKSGRAAGGSGGMCLGARFLTIGKASSIYSDLRTLVLMAFRRFDSSGNIVEHYCDGDLVNQDTATSREPAVLESLYVWGPNLPLGLLAKEVDRETVLPPDVVLGRPAIIS